LIESNHEAVHAKFDVLTHETRVLTKKSNGESVAYELVFDVDGIANDRADATRSCRLVYQGFTELLQDKYPALTPMQWKTLKESGEQQAYH
jgi:hypothetical protein